MNDPILWTLVCLQIAMGGFDVLFHHEFTERLSWKASAASELLLHAARNVFYGVLFFTFAWTQPQGWFAVALAAVLIAEILITLWDFVEEDVSRKLPPSERIAHTLLAINYGAIMAFILPELFTWAGNETALIPASYGWGSIILTVASVGVLIFAAHDVFASARVRNLRSALKPARGLAEALKTRHRVVVTGATGFIGERLVEALSDAGHAVIVLTRNPAKTAHLKPPFTTATDLTALPKDLKVDAIVNLAGEPLANGLWTRAKRLRAYRSRLKAARDVKRFIAHLNTPPKVLIAASGVGYYGLRDDEALTEADKGWNCFTHRLTKAVETANKKAAGRSTRTVALRIGLVLGTRGGLLASLLPAFDWCAGGPIGSGSQWMSWIERDDLVRLIIHAIATEDLDGAVNATAPDPVRNCVFATTLAHALGRPAFLPLPSFLVKTALGEMGRELLLGGQRVLSAKAEISGFRFEHPVLKGALAYCLGRSRKKPTRSDRTAENPSSALRMEHSSRPAA